MTSVRSETFTLSSRHSVILTRNYGYQGLLSDGRLGPQMGGSKQPNFYSFGMFLGHTLNSSFQVPPLGIVLFLHKGVVITSLSRRSSTVHHF